LPSPRIDRARRRVALPTGNNCLDGLVAGAALAPLTEGLRFLLALAPRPSAALNRISGNIQVWD
jgi:hypothetical protein